MGRGIALVKAIAGHPESISRLFNNGSAVSLIAYQPNFPFSSSSTPHLRHGSLYIPAASHLLQTSQLPRRFYSAHLLAASSPWLTETEAEYSEVLRCCRAKVDEFKQVQESPIDDIGIEGQKERTAALKFLAPLAEAWERYVDVRQAIIEIQPHLTEKDESMRDMLISEMEAQKGRLDVIVIDELARLLLPPSHSAGLPVILSLNVGIGGGEAARFLEDLARMYRNYSDSKGWQAETLSESEGPLAKGGGGNGLRETTIKFSPRAYTAEGEACYGDLMWETGIHRVQRVPPGATVDKIHSSTVTVTVSPVYPETTEEALIDPKDVKEEKMRARGAGGQHVNKTESAVRLTHIPTGTVVAMQDHRSQHQNRAYAWDILRARIADQRRKDELEAKRASRADKIRNAFRGDKVRTYNFPQDRVSDHRIGFSTSDLSGVLNGPGYSKLVDAMRDDFAKRRLEALIEGEDDLDE